MERISYYLAKFIQNHVKLKAIKNSKIDKSARVCSGTTMLNSSIGRYSYVGHNSRINNCNIGAFVSIAGDVFIGGSGHPVDWVSTSPVFHTRKNVLGKSFSYNRYETLKYTTIGNDVWIASNVLIKGGISIGDGAVVGMGSVVTKDIPSYEIWAGNPARLIRKRFDDEKKEKLLLLSWWNWDDEDLEGYGDFFSDAEKFLNQFINK